MKIDGISYFGKAFVSQNDDPEQIAIFSSIVMFASISLCFLIDPRVKRLITTVYQKNDYFIKKLQKTEEGDIIHFMNDLSIPTLIQFYEITGIPMCIIDLQRRTKFSFPGSGIPLLNERMVSRCFQEFTSLPHDKKSPLVIVAELIYFLGFAELSTDDYLILGPTRHNRGYRYFVNVLSQAIFLYTGQFFHSEDIVLSNTVESGQETEVSLREFMFFQREQTSSHTPQSWEVGVLQAVEAGDIPLLKRRLAEPVAGRIGQMAKNPLLQERYTFIAFATLLTRAAIKGNLDAETAYSLSDAYCRQMDSMTRTQDINGLSYKMVIDFCQKVALEGSKSGCSPRIQKLCAYISAHLHEDINLGDLSGVSGLCPRSLSNKFREEIGISITDYIHRQKMREASYLLLHSDYDIAGIADFLNYSSQSYFTKIFRDTYGLTPQKYREKQ
jgi:AraC-like DNA-binding protein